MTLNTAGLRVPKRLLRTSNSTPVDRSNFELPTVALLVGVALLVVLIPLLPFLLVAWMISRTLRGVRQRVSWD